MRAFRGCVVASLALATGCAPDAVREASTPSGARHARHEPQQRERIPRQVPVGYGRVDVGKSPDYDSESSPFPPPTPAVVPMHAPCSPARLNIYVVLRECDAVARATTALESEGYYQFPADVTSVHLSRHERLKCAATGADSEASCLTLTLTRRSGSVDLSKPMVGMNKGQWFVSFPRTRPGAPPLFVSMESDGRNLEIRDGDF